MRLAFLAAVFWVIMEKLKITSRQRTISQISRSWDNILQTLILDWTMELLKLFAVGITLIVLTSSVHMD